MTPRVSIVSSAVAGSKRSTRTTDAPRYEREAEHHVHAEDVEQGKHTEHDVVGPEPASGLRLQLLEVRVQVAVREHRRLRGARGAAREEQGGEVVRRARGHRRGVGGEEILERRGIGERVAGGADDEPDRWHRGAVDLAPARAPGRSDDHRGRLDRLDLAHELGSRAERVQRDHDAADPEHGEIRDDERGVVGAEQADPIAGAEPPSDEAASKRRDLLTELAVRRRRAPAHERDGVVGMRLDDLGQIHVRSPP